MKKSLKNLELKKQTISNLNLNKVRGGAGFTSAITCTPSEMNACGNTARTGPGTMPVCIRH
ncbi:hypothetical protein [uncultured Aquimarina sp.]|uniref:hypothetical protein n=1 Tax=uncultured Aquimarina sp. TaxID=575652 RepID=UPI00260EB8AC|nr:hypothetical protein [uncultured Aquimarina sp.]